VVCNGVHGMDRKSALIIPGAKAFATGYDA